MDDLFSGLPDFPAKAADAPTVPGLHYEPGFLTGAEAERLIAFIDDASWSAELSRRVQHYGYRYDYRSRGIDESMRAPALPEWTAALGRRLVKRGFFYEVPDQVIVNEYEPGQGIAPHVDCVPCFHDVIASVSLLSPCVMTFDRRGSDKALKLDLQPGSVVVLTGDARYAWRHGIAGRLHDLIDGVRRPRGRRVSLTFRNVLLH